MIYLYHRVIDRQMVVAYFDDMLVLYFEYSSGYQPESEDTQFLFSICIDQFTRNEVNVKIDLFMIGLLPAVVVGILVHDMTVHLLLPLLVVHHGKHLLDNIVPNTVV